MTFVTGVTLLTVMTVVTVVNVVNVVTAPCCFLEVSRARKLLPCQATIQ